MPESTRKINFLVPDIFSPVIGPVTVLARILEKSFPVSIVGPDLGHGVCPMCRDSYPYISIPTPHLYRLPDYWWERRRIEAALDGDVIIAVKAYASTVPLALRMKKRRGAKVVVYLDEWDGALVRMLPPGKRIRSLITNLHHPMEDIYYPLVEKLIPRADLVISTNTFLQKKFGGSIVQMGVDTDFFRPADAKVRSDMRAQFGLDDKKCVVFGGVVRPHKGIELILDALAKIGNPGYLFVIIGPVNDHVKSLQANPAYAPYLKCLGSQPKERMPGLLGMGDLTVLPLVDNMLARSQTPCKIFEAMSIGLPIIASAVSDLPLILEGAGWIVPPDDVNALADRISHVFSNPVEAQRMGLAAREKCIRAYSKQVTEEQLTQLIRGL